MSCADGCYMDGDTTGATAPVFYCSVIHEGRVRIKRYEGNAVSGKERCIMKRSILLLLMSLFFVLLIGQSVRADNRKLIIVGDSRTEAMHLTVGDSGCVWSYESGSGIIWMKKTGIPAIEKQIGNNTAVVILMGVNDCADLWVTDEYCAYLNAKAAEWAKKGAVTYYFSIPPIVEAIYKPGDITNADIKAWNKAMKSGLTSKVKYVDIYTHMLSGIETYDGLHYKDASTIKYFNLVKRYVNGFDDMTDNSHPYYNAIYWAVNRNITAGYSGTNLFGVNDGCTRSQALTFLWRYSGAPAPKAVSTSPFKDVPKTHPHYKAVLWAYQNGITKGYSNGNFGLNDVCTRGQICTFIWRVKGMPAPRISQNPFADSITPAYKKAVLWAAGETVTKGFSDGTFRDTATCTRGQCMTFIYRSRNL